jgi:hypothetical protein
MLGTGERWKFTVVGGLAEFVEWAQLIFEVDGHLLF